MRDDQLSDDPRITALFDTVDAAEAYAAERRADGHRDAHVVLDRYSNDFEVRDGHVDLSVDVPERGSDRWLFALRVGGYYIRAWDTYRQFGRGGFDRSRCGIIATKAGKVVFLTDAWGPSPLRSIDGPEAQHDACRWVSEAVEGEDGGALSMEAAWRWENPDNGNCDPAAARRYRVACKRETALDVDGTDGVA